MAAFFYIYTWVNIYSSMTIIGFMIEDYHFKCISKYYHLYMLA